MIPTVAFLAAGMSSRYGRLKQLEPVGPRGEALLDYAVFDAHRAGFSRILLIIREELEDIFRAHIEKRWPEDLEIVFHHQKINDLPGLEPGFASSSPVVESLEGRTKPWGTAHALLTAQPHLPGPFVLLNADDFYGSSAFVQAAGFLSEGGARGVGPTPSFGLVTYTLQDTLSEHGGVNRGVCEVDPEGWVGGVREVLDIRREGQGLLGRTVSGTEVGLRGSEPISTNFWLFTPAVFPLLKVEFQGFFREQLEASANSLEFLIPTVVNQAVRNGVARVRGIPTAGRFLGITHPADREWVVAGLENMTEEGQYPTPLWSKRHGKGA